MSGRSRAGNRNGKLGSKNMRTYVALAFGALVAVMTGWTGGAMAQNAEAFLAGTSKDCAGCNLAGAKLKRRNLAGADLSGANLVGATFHRSNLRGANFSGADLTDANLNKTELLQANFSRAKMKGAMLFEAEAGRADFTGADLTEAMMGNIRLTGGKLD